MCVSRFTVNLILLWLTIEESIEVIAEDVRAVTNITHPQALLSCLPNSVGTKPSELLKDGQRVNAVALNHTQVGLFVAHFHMPLPLQTLIESMGRFGGQSAHFWLPTGGERKEKSGLFLGGNNHFRTNLCFYQIGIRGLKNRDLDSIFQVSCQCRGRTRRNSFTKSDTSSVIQAGSDSAPLKN